LAEPVPRAVAEPAPTALPLPGSANPAATASATKPINSAREFTLAASCPLAVGLHLGTTIDEVSPVRPTVQVVFRDAVAGS
jgi:hypothetical protein